MLTQRDVIAAFLALTLTTFCAGSAMAEATAQKIEAAKTSSELVRLGATKLSVGQFKAKVVGKPMAGKGWNWSIDRDGTTSSNSTDNSWKETKKPWSMKGDKYCVELKGAVKCRDVYMIGPYLRMSDQDDPKKLSDWTAKIK